MDRNKLTKLVTVIFALLSIFLLFSLCMDAPAKPLEVAPASIHQELLDSHEAEARAGGKDVWIHGVDSAGGNKPAKE